VLDGKFIVHRKDDVRNSSSQVVTMDPATGAIRNLFERTLSAAGAPVAVNNGVRIAVAEGSTGTVHFVDPVSLERTSFETGGSPRAIAAIGSCVVVGLEHEKKGLVIKAPVDGVVEVVDQFDFNSFGAAFRGLRSVAADPATGRIYGLSVYPCNPYMQNCKDSWNAIVATPRSTRASIAGKCLN
ncbi:hypothetical protein EBZ80_27785, partial [bacterium]|nr:hypothetical protein [bacterium]